MARAITEQEKQLAAAMLARARAAMAAIENYDQATVDRLCRAVAWATANMETATKLANMSEEIPEKGIVKYAKPAGVVAALIPVTSAYVTPAGMAIYAIKCKDAVIFCPHPASKKTTNETIRVMRAALEKLGAPEDILQCVEAPSIPLSQEIMSICDVTM